MANAGFRWDLEEQDGLQQREKEGLLDRESDWATI